MLKKLSTDDSYARYTRKVLICNYLTWGMLAIPRSQRQNLKSRVLARYRERVGASGAPVRRLGNSSNRAKFLRQKFGQKDIRLDRELSKPQSYCSCSTGREFPGEVSHVHRTFVSLSGGLINHFGFHVNEIERVISTVLV